MKEKIFSLQNMVQIAMLTTILAILSQVSFILPGGIPVTLQTFAIFLIGILLGPVKGTISVLLYLLMGAVGIPVFANFKSGLTALVGPTGGFLLGFLPMVFMTGLGSRLKFGGQVACNIVGMLACYACGLLMYYSLTGVSILPTVPLMLAKDCVISVVAVFIGREVKLHLSPLR